MPLIRWLGRTLNRTLATQGLRLDYLESDFDSRPLDQKTLSRVFARMGGVFEEWRSGQRMFHQAEIFDATAATEDFYAKWIRAPFRAQQGGSRFNNLLWLYLIAKSYQPSLIVDSGTYQGASAWALAMGAPQAAVLSFDISLGHLRERAKGVIYTEKDWGEYDLAGLDLRRFLCYFDDHIDQARRLIEASDRGCNLAIFDDDYPVTSYYAMAPGPSVLPKIEFVIDPDLSDGQRLEWQTRTGRHAFIVDRSYLDAARARISITERLPNTSLITGIHQTPYRLVAVAPPLG
jgi:hypothetical protein